MSSKLTRSKRKATLAKDLRDLEANHAMLAQSVLMLTQQLRHLAEKFVAIERHLAGDNVPRGMQETKSGLVVPKESK